MPRKPLAAFRGKKVRYALYGFLIGLSIITVIFYLETLVLEIPFSIEAWIQHQQGEPVHWLVNSAPLVLGTLGLFLGAKQDELDELQKSLHTRVSEATRDLQYEKVFFESLLVSNPLAIVILDENESILSINPAFEELFQYSLQEVAGKKIDDLVTNEKSRNEALGFTKKALGGGMVQESTVRYRKDGSGVPVDIYAVQVIFAGNKLGALAIYEDVSERVAYQKKLTSLVDETVELAKTDALTGLFNRRAITEFAEKEFALAKKNGKAISMLLIDIDHFKEINDTHGHDAGDKALREVAFLLNADKRVHDGLGRWGGDEFMMVMPNTALADARELGKRLCSLIDERQIYVAKRQPVHLTISVGAAGIGRGKSKVELIGLFQAADKALYEAKRKGRNQSA